MTPRYRFSRAINAFLRQMAADGRTSASIQSYRRQLVLLTQALGDVPLSRLTPDRLNGYLSSPAVQLKAEGMPKEASTINRTKSVIRAFFRWCDQTGLMKRNPAAQVRLAVASTPVTRHMTRMEVSRFLRTIRDARHPLAARDHALFATLAYTGIRLSDVICLRLSDVDLRHRQLVLRRAGIQKALSVHSLRHTFGTLLYQATKDLVLVSRALGHRDVKSTQRYAHLDDRQLVRAIGC